MTRSVPALLLGRPYFDSSKKSSYFDSSKKKKHRHKSTQTQTPTQTLFFRIESVNQSVLPQQANTGLKSFQRQGFEIKKINKNIFLFHETQPYCYTSNCLLRTCHKNGRQINSSKPKMKILVTLTC